MLSSPTLPKVFVVDDDVAVRDSLRLALELRGMQVEEYGSTAEFLDRYSSASPGILILDQHLPVTEGLDFLASADGRRLRIPVILVTGRGDAVIRQRAEALGVAAYFDKPVSTAKLIATIRSLLGEA